MRGDFKKADEDPACPGWEGEDARPSSSVEYGRRGVVDVPAEGKPPTGKEGRVREMARDPWYTKIGTSSKLADLVISGRFHGQ